MRCVTWNAFPALFALLIASIGERPRGIDAAAKQEAKEYFGQDCDGG
jgi:hypothetical protein